MSRNEASPSGDGRIAEVITATAVSTLLVAGIIFCIVYRYAIARERRKNKPASSFRREPAVDLRNFTPHARALDTVVDDKGSDVLYLQKLEGGQLGCFSTIWFNPLEEEDKRMHTRGDKSDIYNPIHEVPLLHDTSDIIHYTDEKFPGSSLLPQQPSPHMARLPEKQTPPPPLPPPPPPPPPPIKNNSRPPPPPKIPAKRNYPGPPPRKGPGALISPLKPPTAARSKVHDNSKADALTEERPTNNGEVHMKMKPLHWEKVSANVDHSLVWNEINDGSLGFDDDIIEALFGYNAANNKISTTKNISAMSGSSSSTSPAQIFILDPRKSQNTAIVLKSLAISRNEILEALQEGCGLHADTLEKLTRISPTQEEAAKILQFNGNPAELAYAESFLYQILKSVPLAFIRINAMLFRSNYDPDILHFKESLQTLEFGCKELRARGVFYKLLEAILKAGNRMNAGTARGNAQGFNLNALRKLSTVKSTDGKTTLLHFVVEQVAQAEGKRAAINKIHEAGSTNTQHDEYNDQDSDCLTGREDRSKEHLMLGLPILSRLSIEFSNVKKASTVDPDTFMNGCSNLIVQVIEIKKLVAQCNDSDTRDFVKEMKGFIEECEEELKVVREEQIRVTQLVQKTTEFYQAGASKAKGANPLQIFIFVKEFLDMVDQTCSEIKKRTQKKNVRAVDSPPLLSPSTRASVMLQNPQLYSLPEKSSSTSSSKSEDDFCDYVPVS